MADGKLLESVDLTKLSFDEIMDIIEAEDPDQLAKLALKLLMRVNNLEEKIEQLNAKIESSE